MWCLQKAAGYGSISLVQMKGADSDWMGMTNKYGEAWEVPVTPKLPWDFRIVGADGQEASGMPPADSLQPDSWLCMTGGNAFCMFLCQAGGSHRSGNI